MKKSALKWKKNRSSRRVCISFLQNERKRRRLVEKTSFLNELESIYMCSFFIDFLSPYFGRFTQYMCKFRHFLFICKCTKFLKITSQLSIPIIWMNQWIREVSLKGNHKWIERIVLKQCMFSFSVWDYSNWFQCTQKMHPENEVHDNKTGEKVWGFREVRTTATTKKNCHQHLHMLRCSIYKQRTNTAIRMFNLFFIVKCWIVRKSMRLLQSYLELFTVTFELKTLTRRKKQSKAHFLFFSFFFTHFGLCLPFYGSSIMN